MRDFPLSQLDTEIKLALIQDDPREFAFVHGAPVAQKILSNVYIKELGPRLKEFPYTVDESERLINDLIDKGILPERIKLSVRILALYARITSWGEERHILELADARALLIELVRWYYRDYLPDKTDWINLARQDEIARNIRDDLSVADIRGFFEALGKREEQLAEEARAQHELGLALQASHQAKKNKGEQGV